MRFNHSPKLFLGLSLLILTVGVRAQNVIYTTTATAAGNWDLTANWAGGLVGSGAGNTAVQGAGGVTMTLDVPETLGIVKDGQGSSRTWTINASGTVAMTFDNTGNTANNPNNDLNAWLGSTSSGSMIFRPNIIIQNTDLEIEQSGSTTPSGAVGTLGTSTITATSARNLILIQNEAKAGEKVFVINSSIGGAGSSFITVSNVGPGSGTMDVTGIIGPNAGVVENSPVGSFTSNLELANGGNTYTGSTIITNGTLQLGAANTIPSVSVVYIYGAADNGSGILQMSGFSDVIDGLNGSGTVNTGAAGAQTLTVGGNNSGGSFSGIIENTTGTLSLTKTGTGTQVLNGANTYSGTTTLNGGILNAGIADSPGSSGPFGLATSVGSIVFGGGTLQYSNTVNNQDYSGRFSTAASQPISIDAAGSAVTFATALISSGGSLRLADSVGGGSLTLTAAETYSGNTTINGGSLVLGSGGSLANNSSVNIGAGGTLDVSAQASPYALGTGANFRASGTGTATTTAATLVPAAGGIFNLGTQPVSLTWSGAASGTDNTHPPLTVSQGTLQFNGNSITVVVPGTALGVGVYTLISASAAAISGTPSSVPLFGGNGLALGDTAAISVSGGNVILTVTLSPSTVGTWTGGAGSPFNWSASGNWSGGVPQSAGDSAIFGSAVTAVLLNTAESVGTLEFNNNSGAYTIAGSATLTLDNKGNGAAVKVTTAGANLVQPPVSLNDSSGNTTITVNSGDSLAISGNISSTSTNETLTLVNAGTNILSGANTYGPLAGYVGTTFSGGGVLQLGNSSALGAGDLSMPASSGTLQAGAAGLSVANNVIVGTGLTVTANNNGYNLTLGGAISGGASLTATGSGTLTLNGNNTYTGNTTVNAGVLSISSANNVSSPNIILNGGDLLGNGTFAEVNNIGIGSASGPAGTNALIDAASGQTFTVSGVIATAGNGGVNSLTINSVTPSPGEVTLTGANTYNGTTVIANGTLDVANSLALQDSTLNYSSGTLVFDSSISAATFAGLTGTKNLSLANLSPGPVALTVGGNNANIYYNNIGDAGLGGSLIKLGTGTMVVTNATYTGNTTIGGSGTLTILGGSFGSLSSTITTGNGGGAAFLNVSGGSVSANQLYNGAAANSTGCGVSLTGSATGTFNNVQLGAGGDTSGAFTINTTGSVSLGSFIDYKDNSGTGANTGTGLIVDNGPVTATSVIIQNTSSGGNMTINGGSLTVGTSSSTGAFLVGNSNSNRGGWLSMTGGALTYLGTDGLLMDVNAASASGAFLYGGTATLTGITLDDGAATGASSTLTVSNGATLYLGSVGLVDSDPAPIANAVTFANGTVAAIAPWSSSVAITLVSNAVIKAADSTGAAQGITLGGILSGNGGLTKTGAGTLALTGANTYVGPTAINASTLSLGSSGSLASTNIIVGSGTIFDVSGLSSAFTLVSGQTLTGGGAGATVNGLVDLGSGALAVNYTNGTPALTFNSPLTAANNTVTVNVLGAPLGLGTYTLATYNPTGSSVMLNTNPVITGAGLAGADVGVITNTSSNISLIVIAGVNTAPTNIVTAYNGTSLTLSWPADHIGWRLQVQTNPLVNGLNPASNAWFTVSGSTTVNTNIITVNPANGSVFYRLVYP